MASRRRRETPAPALTPGVLAVLLCGWSGRFTDGDASDSALFDIWMRREAGVVETFRAHRDFVLDEARRRNVKPAYQAKDGAWLHFAQWCALTPDQRGDTKG